MHWSLSKNASSALIFDKSRIMRDVALDIGISFVQNMMRSGALHGHRHQEFEDFKLFQELLCMEKPQIRLV